MNFENEPVDLSKILLARKLSVLEYDSRELGFTQKETIEHYKENGTDWETILASHKRQVHSLRMMKEELPEVEFVTGFQLTRDLVSDRQAVIALGGDDHYQYVSHFLDRQYLIPVNSDTVKSDGALADFAVPDFVQFITNLKAGVFTVEPWTRLQVHFNGQPIREQAISQVYIGAVDNEDMGRYTVEYNGQKETQKSSGIIVATGTGSGGWYDTASRYIYPDGNRFPRITKRADFVTREPFNGQRSEYQLKIGEIFPGEKLTVTSLMNKPGRVGIDALIKKDFPRGATMTVELSDSPLSVIRKALI